MALRFGIMEPSPVQQSSSFRLNLINAFYKKIWTSISYCDQCGLIISCSKEDCDEEMSELLPYPIAYGEWESNQGCEHNIRIGKIYLSYNKIFTIEDLKDRFLRVKIDMEDDPLKEPDGL